MVLCNRFTAFQAKEIGDFYSDFCSSELEAKASYEDLVKQNKEVKNYLSAHTQEESVGRMEIPDALQHISTR